MKKKRVRYTQRVMKKKFFVSFEKNIREKNSLLGQKEQKRRSRDSLALIQLVHAKFIITINIFFEILLSRALTLPIRSREFFILFQNHLQKKKNLLFVCLDE